MALLGSQVHYDALGTASFCILAFFFRPSLSVCIRWLFWFKATYADETTLSDFLVTLSEQRETAPRNC